MKRLMRRFGRPTSETTGAKLIEIERRLMALP